MKERSNNKDRITKTGDFPQRTTKKLRKVKTLMEKVKEVMKKQFDKNR